MKKILTLIFIILFPNIIFGIESKIIYRIENEIITNIDIKNEYKYLITLNSNLKNLNKDKVFDIATKSIIKEKIKKNEIINNFKNLDIDNEYIEGVIKSIYTKLQLESKEEFINHLKKNNLRFNDIKKKIKIEALWNRLILEKYSQKTNINLDKIKSKILENSETKSKTYLLSEIIFEVVDKDDINRKLEEIKLNIEEIGFENTASTYSISDSSKTGGSIGWINENTMSNKIKLKLSNIEIGELTKPIIVPGGILVLMIVDVKEDTKKIDLANELKKRVNTERNKQLNQYSKIYFNKIKKNLQISE